MTDFEEPRTEIEWSRRAIINVVDVLAVHAESLTLVGAHAVLLRTVDLDVPRMPTGDGDLGVTPGLVGDLPSIEGLLSDAVMSTARPRAPGSGAAMHTTSPTARGPSARRSTCSLRMGCPEQPVGASGAFPRCSPRMASLPSAMPLAWNSQPSTDR